MIKSLFFDEEIRNLCEMVGREMETEKLLALIRRLNEAIDKKQRAQKTANSAPTTRSLSVVPPEEESGPQ
jgi:hypothetical protein